MRKKCQAKVVSNTQQDYESESTKVTIAVENLRHDS